jgi:hypothetical protein
LKIVGVVNHNFLLETIRVQIVEHIPYKPPLDSIGWEDIFTLA